jgi:hypothetical protein
VFVAAQLVGGAIAYATIRVLYPQCRTRRRSEVVVPHDTTVAEDEQRAAHRF